MKASAVACLVALALLGCQPAGDAIGTLSGQVLAGPVCPVVRDPPDPACADRPVPDATLVIEIGRAGDVIRVSSDEAGHFQIVLPPGDYILVPQPVDGLMGTAPAQPFEIEANRTTELRVVYDTGIR